MSENIFQLRDILANSPVVDDAPAPDLWPRIAAAHATRIRRRRTLRFSGIGLVATSALCAVLLIPGFRSGSPDALASVDWQARAQALELQLDALPMPVEVGNSHSIATVAQISRLDSQLQTAYDGGAAHETIAALWKQRSELLSVLLSDRRQQPVVSDI